MNPTEQILKTVEGTTGVFSLQEADDLLFEQSDKIVIRGGALYKCIVGEQKKIDELRMNFVPSNVRTEDCEASREKCSKRQCGCSYADMRELNEKSKLLASLNRQLDACARNIRDLQVVHSQIIWPRIQAYLQDKDTLGFLAELLCICGEISYSQHLLMDLPGFFTVSGSALAVELHFGRDPVETAVLKSQRQLEIEGR